MDTTLWCTSDGVKGIDFSGPIFRDRCTRELNLRDTRLGPVLHFLSEVK